MLNKQKETDMTTTAVIFLVVVAIGAALLLILTTYHVVSNKRRDRRQAALNNAYRAERQEALRVTREKSVAHEKAAARTRAARDEADVYAAQRSA